MGKNVSFVTEYDMYLLAQATHYEIYEKLGAHIGKQGKKTGVYLDVWAPNAKNVWVIGTFNDWNETSHPMKRLEPNGVYEAFIPEAKEGDCYKYLIETVDGRKLYKADPYANYAELRPGTASRVADLSKIKWTDDKWMEARKAQTDIYSQPMSIYEVHLGSWKCCFDEEGKQQYYNYRQLAVELTKYVKEMGYTHVELMGISEYPFDGSWGYQVTGYYAPTSRYGAPEDFAYLVNYLHRNKIGVILDWVPAHFPRDAHGLAEFDGTCLYEYADTRKGEHPEWGTKIFDYSKNEVKNFLIASALMWIEKFHVDGLRVDAVASMLYLNYGKKDGQWVPNKYGGEYNLEAIEFFKHINTLIQGRNPGVMMMAEESTSFPGITNKAEYDGLNFTYKWNMGWMNDFLEYMKLDPIYRKHNHHKMTFAMSYNHSEKYILVLSHDEVVHLKCAMINKMPGYELDKYKNLKVGYAFMMGHPGKKLLFMGQDIAQHREWSEARELDWFELENPENQNLQTFVKDLLHMYKKYPSLYTMDHQQEGFQWINADDMDRSIYSFVRHGKTKRNSLLFVCNFTPMERPDYRVGVPKGKKYTLILDSEDPKYGGHAPEDKQKEYKAEKSECDGQEYSFAYPLPAYGVAVFKF